MNLPQARQTQAERRAYYGRIVDPAHLRVDVTVDEMVIAGDYAFARGAIRLERTGPSQTSPPRELCHMEVWRRFPQGWRATWGIDAEVYPEPK